MNNDDNGLTGYLDEQANLYHTTGQSAISDAVYDSLARTVGRVVVGAKEGNNTVKHNTPMLSLNNILTTGVCDQVETWEYTALSHWMSTVLSRLPMIRDSVGLSRYSSGVLLLVFLERFHCLKLLKV